MKTIKHITGIPIAALLLAFSACSEMDENSNTEVSKQATTEDMMKEGNHNPDELVFTKIPMQYTSYLYTESNELGTNHILIYQKKAGRDLDFVGSVPTGGAGNGLPLESQGAVILTANNKYLFAVNAGSNSISSFIVKNETLELIQTSPSGGETPVSLTIHGDWLYVLHSGNSSINGFRIGKNGIFAPIPDSKKKLGSKTAGPVQISFCPDGNYLYVTEKTTNIISKFNVDETGLVGERNSEIPIGNTPSAFGFARKQYMIVSNAEMGIPNLSSVTSYSGLNFGRFTDVNGAVANGQTSAGWLAGTQYGRYIFVSNTDTDNLSSYYVSEDGKLYLVKDNIPCGDAPGDIAVASDNYTVYVLCDKDDTIQQYTRTELGGLVHTGVLTGIPPHAAGLATW